MGSKEVGKMNISSYQEVWDSQGEGRSRAVSIEEDVGRVLFDVRESGACLSTDGKRPVSLCKSFFLAPAFCLKVCIVAGNFRADHSEASE